MDEDLKRQMEKEYREKFGEGCFAVMERENFFKELEEKIKFKEKWEKKLKK